LKNTPQHITYKSTLTKIANPNADYKDKPEKGSLMKRMMVMVCIGVFLGIFLIPSGAAAWNDVQLQQLRTKNHCPNCDLRGANLQWADLRGANLSGADLSGAILSGANMTEANMTKVNLSGAILSRADMTVANMACQ